MTQFPLQTLLMNLKSYSNLDFIA